MKAYRKARAAWQEDGTQNGNESGNRVREEIVA